MIPELVQEILVAIIVAAAVIALVSRFVVHRRVRRCPSCGPDPARSSVGRGIREPASRLRAGLDILS